MKEMYRYDFPVRVEVEKLSSLFFLQTKRNWTFHLIIEIHERHIRYHSAIREIDFNVEADDHPWYVSIPELDAWKCIW